MDLEESLSLLNPDFFPAKRMITYRPVSENKPKKNGTACIKHTIPLNNSSN